MPRRLACLGTSILLLLIGAGALGRLPSAAAAWSATGAGPAAQRGMLMPAGGAPTVSGVDLSPVGRRFTLTWTTSWLHSGRPVTGYLITRTSTLNGGSLISGGSCAQTTTAAGVSNVYVPTSPSGAQQSCTDDALVTLGTVRYAVTPVYGRWLGTASSWSTPTT